MRRDRIFWVAVGLGLLCSACSRPDVEFPRFVRDHIIVWGVLGAIQDIYADSLATAPAGPVDLQLQCPGGGQVQVKGTVTSPGREGSFSLEFAGCGIVQSEEQEMEILLYLDVILTGTMTHELSFDAQGFGSEQLQAGSLAIEGEEYLVPHLGDIDIDCPFAARHMVSEVSGAVSGNICERPVSWSYSHSACQ